MKNLLYRRQSADTLIIGCYAAIFKHCRIIIGLTLRKAYGCLAMHRLFVAIRPPPGHRAQLLAMMGGVAGARWQSDDQLHLTLRFIGDVDRHGAQDIADALRRIRLIPFQARLCGVGTFDRRGTIDTLWAGVQPHDALASLHKKVDRACVSVGLPAESRAYMPHITLARFGRSGGLVDPFLATHATLDSPPFTVNGFSLFESRLGHGGSTYQAIDHYGSRADIDAG